MWVDPSSAEWAATEEFVLMFRDVANAFVAVDPERLFALTKAVDEYDVEAAQIVRLVLRDATTRDDVSGIVRDVAAHYFGDRCDDERLEQVADAVWRRFEEIQTDRG